MRRLKSLAKSHSLRKLLLIVLALIVVGALVYRAHGIIRLENFSWERLGHSIRQARGSLLLAAVVGIYAGYAVRALRWMRFSRYLGRPTFTNVFTSTVMGFATIFLFGRPAEPIRPLLIARKERLPVASVFGTYALERVFDTASTAVIMGLALLFLPRLESGDGAQSAVVTVARSTGFALLVGLVAAIVFLVYLRLGGAETLERRLAGWHAASGWKRRFAGIFTSFSEGLQAIRTSGDLLAGIGYSALHWLLITVIYVLVAHSFGGRLAELGFRDALLVLAFSMVGSTLQLPGIGGGSQVASFLAFAKVFRIENEPAAAASIVLWLITFAASSLAGVPLLIREGWSMGELRRLARAEAEAEAAGAHVALPEALRTGRSRRPGRKGDLHR
jgi:uncharacterized protein (TIRG00374 family)